MEPAFAARGLDGVSRKTGFPDFWIYNRGKVFWLYKWKRWTLGLLRAGTATRMKITIFTAIIFCIGLAIAGHTQSCKYWCKSEEEHVYYCCPSGKPDKWSVQSMWPIMSSPIFWMGVIGTTLGIHAHTAHTQHPQPMEMPPMKKKLCPPMRSVCPRSFDWYDPPNYCDNDDECHNMEKCCYDVCLEHKTCKPAE